jgi:hypothetical protein
MQNTRRHNDTSKIKKTSSVWKKRQSVDQRNTNEKEVKDFLYKILLFLIFTGIKRRRKFLVLDFYFGLNL